tara:strand:- start:4262 stop:5683 length:1422 start_codon:yes stop_codon:yes gene_type:complete
MGAEAYGLVGFFTMMQAWFSFLDLGLTPTISRQTARYHGGSMTPLAFRQLFRALSLIFVIVALFGGGSLWLSAGFIANSWLKVDELKIGDVVLAVQIMAISVALRWMSGLYRGVVTGSERLVSLGVFNVVIATLRFIAVFATMSLYGFTPFVFFLHQLAVAILEIAGLLLMAYQLLPSRNQLNGNVGWSFKPVKPVLRFALMIAFTSSIWVLVTQTDKLVLSGILSLVEYGHFTLAVLVASGIMVISGPVSMAIMPRMAKLYAESKRREMIEVYRNTTQVVTVTAVSAAITIALCAEPLLHAWTGDTALAQEAAPILRLYSIGYGFLALGAFAYYLQYAVGVLRYHLIGNSIMVVTLIPSIVFAAKIYGGIGAGYVWLILNFLFFFIWVGFVHRKIAPGLHLSWLRNDIAIIVLPVLFTLTFISSLKSEVEFQSRLDSLAYVAIMSVSAVVVGMIMSPYVRKMFSFERVDTNK